MAWKGKPRTTYDTSWKSYLTRDEKEELRVIDARIAAAAKEVSAAVVRRKALISGRHVLQNRATARRRRDEAAA